MALTTRAPFTTLGTLSSCPAVLAPQGGRFTNRSLRSSRPPDKYRPTLGVSTSVIERRRRSNYGLPAREEELIRPSLFREASLIPEPELSQFS
jgi:hypothetical protein